MTYAELNPSAIMGIKQELENLDISTVKLSYLCLLGKLYNLDKDIYKDAPGNIPGLGDPIDELIGKYPNIVEGINIFNVGLDYHIKEDIITINHILEIVYAMCCFAQVGYTNSEGSISENLEAYDKIFKSQHYFDNRLGVHECDGLFLDIITGKEVELSTTNYIMLINACLVVMSVSILRQNTNNYTSKDSTVSPIKTLMNEALLN